MNAITRNATKEMPYARGASAFILATSSGECACASIHCLAKSSGEYHSPPIRNATTAATMIASQWCDGMRVTPVGCGDRQKPERTYERLVRRGRRGSYDACSPPLDHTVFVSPGFMIIARESPENADRTSASEASTGKVA